MMAPERPSLTDPGAIAALFPATQKAQREAFSALIAASQASTPLARAAVLSNSVLASAYHATKGAPRPRSKDTEEEEAMANQQAVVNDTWDKMERNRLRDHCANRQAQARELNKLNKTLAEEHAKLAADSAARRVALSEQFDSAIAGLQARRSAETARRAEVAAENAGSAETLEKWRRQVEATEAHQQAESQAKTLEQRLCAARLAELDALLTDACDRGRRYTHTRVSAPPAGSHAA